ncbi:hypothetical protein Cp4440_01389 [Clostridium perfringens]|nr:hypothetical protein [Clostridium perfringens]
MLIVSKKSLLILLKRYLVKQYKKKLKFLVFKYKLNDYEGE